MHFSIFRQLSRETGNNTRSYNRRLMLSKGTALETLWVTSWQMQAAAAQATTGTQM